jgi:hypothetical protein
LPPVHQELWVDILGSGRGWMGGVSGCGRDLEVSAWDGSVKLWHLHNESRVRKYWEKYRELR